VLTVCGSAAPLPEPIRIDRRRSISEGGVPLALARDPCPGAHPRAYTQHRLYLVGVAAVAAGSLTGCRTFDSCRGTAQGVFIAVLDGASANPAGSVSPSPSPTPAPSPSHSQLSRSAVTSCCLRILSRPPRCSTCSPEPRSSTSMEGNASAFAAVLQAFPAPRGCRRQPQSAAHRQQWVEGEARSVCDGA
jgi:hypothetical protein